MRGYLHYNFIFYDPNYIPPDTGWRWSPDASPIGPEYQTFDPPLQDGPIDYEKKLVREVNPLISHYFAIPIFPFEKSR